MEPRAVVDVVVGAGGGKVVNPVACPGMETIVVVEHVVGYKLGLNLVGTLEVPGVGGLDVEQEIGVDGVALAAGVVGILLADIFADELQFGIFEGTKVAMAAPTTEGERARSVVPVTAVCVLSPVSKTK